jgi:hypothetical protein
MRQAMNWFVMSWAPTPPLSATDSPAVSKLTAALDYTQGLGAACAEHGA